MKFLKIKCVLLLVFSSVFCGAQFPVFQTDLVHVENAKKILYHENGYVIFNTAFSQSKPYGLSFVDTLGNFNGTFYFGDAKTDIASNATLSQSGDYHLWGRTWIDSINSFAGQIIVVNNWGIEEKTISFKPDNILSTQALVGIFLNGYYYVVCHEIDSTLSVGKLSPFSICKVDETGHIVWHFQVPAKYNEIATIPALALSYNQQSLLFGLSNVSPNSTVVREYLLLQVDTNGNFKGQIDLPHVNLDTFHTNEVLAIQLISDSIYFVSCSNNLFFLDTNFTIIENDSLTNFLLPPRNKNAYKSPIESSYVVQGADQFMKLYRGQMVFRRSFEDELKLIGVKDLLPCLDGGFLIASNNLQGTLLTKVDCNGKYDNPTYCDKKIDRNSPQLNHTTSGWQIYFNQVTRSKSNVMVYDMLGKLIATYDVPKAIYSFNIGLDSTSSGIYLIRLLTGNEEFVFKALK